MPQQTPKFQVGDIVRVKQAASEQFYTAQIIRIHLRPNGVWYRVNELGGYNTSIMVNEERLTLYRA